MGVFTGDGSGGVGGFLTTVFLFGFAGALAASDAVNTAARKLKRKLKKDRPYVDPVEGEVPRPA